MASADETSSRKLKDWALRELVSSPEEDSNVVVDVLAKSKDGVAEHFRVRSDGKVTIRNREAPAKEQLIWYFIGAAYDKIADVREEDSVENKELIAETGIKEGTVKPGIKSLTESDYIVQKKAGVYRLNYMKLGKILKQLGEGKAL